MIYPEQPIGVAGFQLGVVLQYQLVKVVELDRQVTRILMITFPLGGV